jgi:hypothetical protein
MVFLVWLPRSTSRLASLFNRALQDHWRVVCQPLPLGNGLPIYGVLSGHQLLCHPRELHLHFFFFRSLQLGATGIDFIAQFPFLGTSLFLCLPVDMVVWVVKENEFFFGNS